MVRDELSILSAFLAVAEERSFTRAAKRLSVSTSALSHAIRRLEEDIGIRLLARTTRSVAPTEAGLELLAHLRPALADIQQGLDKVSRLGDKPSGRVRLLVSPIASAMLVAPKLEAFARDYPDIVLDVTTTSEMRLDLVAGRFDAGLQLGELIQPDMIAVRVSRDQRAAVVGAPRYFASHSKPKSPRDLTNHRWLSFRLGTDERYRWEFRKSKQSLTVALDGPLIANDLLLMTRATLDGVGLAYMMDEYAAPYLASGELVEVLEDWSARFGGYFLYFPSRRQQPAALEALIAALRV
jgi:DNA-binding transcriptional LysR family regulator